MVFGACVIEEQDRDHLRALGTRDSKRLSPKRRKNLRNELERCVVAWRTLNITAEIIDRKSINEIGKDAIVELVLDLKPDVVVVDAPVPPRGLPEYRAELERRFTRHNLDSVQIIAENKADDTYPCCAAASIFAKTTRDGILAVAGDRRTRRRSTDRSRAGRRASHPHAFAHLDADRSL